MLYKNYVTARGDNILICCAYSVYVQRPPGTYMYTCTQVAWHMNSTLLTVKETQENCTQNKNNMYNKSYKVDLYSSLYYIYGMRMNKELDV